MWIFLLNTENLKDQDNYALRLKAFSALNKDLIQNADYITDICRIETEYKKNISDIVHLVSIIISLAIFILLIYLILHNFYNPLLEIKKVFKSMSKGKIKQHFVRKQEDEFKELYNDFNHFIDNLNLIFSLEDKILLENQLDNILEFIYANFRRFIPFTTMGITFQSIDHVIITKNINAFGIEEHRDPNGKLEIIQEIKSINQEILCPIIIGNANLGYVFFQFPKEDVIEESHLNFLQLIRDKISLAFYKSFLFRDLLGIVTTSLANMAESRDPETGRHLYRMANYSLLVAKRLKEKGIYTEEIDQNFIDNILVTAPMHDIGKVAVPDEVLLKQGKLTDEEFELIKQHPQAGAKVLMGLHQEFKKYNIEYFQMAADIAIGHQEKYDGSGYPYGTSGDEIPLSARICAVSDVFDALSSKRPYKDAFPLEKCYQIIRESRGTHFDPEIVDAFFDVQDQVEVIYEINKEV